GYDLEQAVGADQIERAPCVVLDVASGSTLMRTAYLVLPTKFKKPSRNCPRRSKSNFTVRRAQKVPSRLPTLPHLEQWHRRFLPGVPLGCLDMAVQRWAQRGVLFPHRSCGLRLGPTDVVLQLLDHELPIADDALDQITNRDDAEKLTITDHRQVAHA